MIRALVIAGGVVVLAGAAAVTLGPWTSEPARMVLDTSDAQAVTLGAQVYTETCAACHGARLEGQPDWQTRGSDGLLPAPPHDETGHTWHHDGETLFRLTKHGVGAYIGDPEYRSGMPAYEGILSDQEILAVLTYIKSTWPEEIRARHDAMEAGE